ncbi:MAG TPA: phospholipase D-like domain-containing protein [Bacilli bacterium]
MKRKKIVIPVILLAFVIGSAVYASGESRNISPESLEIRPGSIEWAFTNNGVRPEKKLIGMINATEKTLDVAIFALTNPGIVKAIKDAKKRGVAVRVITDKGQAETKTQAQALKLFLRAGIPVKINTHDGLMHLKMAISDENIVSTGSFNYTKAAANKNDEILMFLSDPEVARSFKLQFEKMWVDKQHFSDYRF